MEVERVVVKEVPANAEQPEVIVEQPADVLNYSLFVRPAPGLQENNHGPFGAVDPEKLYLQINDDEVFLKTVQGKCDTINTPSVGFLISEGLISDTNQIISHVSCWFGGGGSATYLVNVDGEYKVFYHERGECGISPECSPNGPIEVLY